MAGIPEPTMVNGISQAADRGLQHAASFNDANAPEFHETQYFEMIGNRGIYQKGWTAVMLHKAPWVAKPRALEHRRVRTLRPPSAFGKPFVPPKAKLNPQAGHSAESPGPDKESNWLPAPKAGGFTMNPRLYWPKP